MLVMHIMMLQYIVLVSLLCLFSSLCVAHDVFDIGPEYLVSSDGDEEQQDVKPDVFSLHVYSTVQYRYAHTLVTSRVANRANTSREVYFSILLPENAFISGFLMEIDGKVYKAHVKEKEEAKREYTQAVNAGQSAGHVAQVARNSNRFSISVNIEPQKKVTFNLTYEELLKRELSLYNLEINLNPGQIVQDLLVQVNINESSPVTVLNVPELRVTNEIMEVESENSIADIERTSNSSAVIRWIPTPEQQSEYGVKGQLVVQYDVDRSSNPEQILVNEGYFVHFFALENLQPMKKHVVFVLDVSGSMRGRKMEQLKEAMHMILDDFRPDDYFSLVTFSKGIKVWNLDSLTFSCKNQSYSNHVTDVTGVFEANQSNINKAKSFISTIEDCTTTNIYSALSVGIEVIEIGRYLRYIHKEIPNPMIIFLTDGKPNVGERNPIKITKFVSRRNKLNNAAIFSLCFGDDADYDFLKKLSLQNFGFSRKIYEASDTALQLKNFYKEISSPLLSDVTFMYGEDQVKNGSLTNRVFSKFYNGSELVIAGKLTSNSISGIMTAQSEVGSKCLKFKPLVFVPHTPTLEKHITPEKTNTTFMERLWAYLTIKQILDKRVSNYPSKAESTSRALELALQYSFVTPLTSLVVVKPNSTSYTDTKEGDTHRFQRPVSNHKVHKTSGLQPILLLGGPKPRSFSYNRQTAKHSTSLINNGFNKPFGNHIQNGRVHRRRPSIVRPDDDSDSVEDIFNGLPDCIGSTRPCTRVFVTLSQLSWLNRTTDNQSNIYINTVVNGTSKSLLVAQNKTNKAFESCEPPISTKSHCRHLEYCPLKLFSNSFDNYVKYQCVIDQIYAGVCCPDTVMKMERRIKSVFSKL